jgi:hypothetical protein
MTTTFTQNKGYALPATGDDPNAWGPVLNNNFSTIDSNISSGIGITTTGGSVYLTATQAENLYFYINGTLTSDVTVRFPAKAGFFFVLNGVSGNFSVSVDTVTGANYVTIAPGQSAVCYSDGSNVLVIAGSTTSPIPSGTVMGSFLQASAPTGWTQSSAFNDQVIRLIGSGAGGGTGGSWTISGATVAGTALSISQMPAHNHTVTLDVGGTTAAGTGSVPIQAANATVYGTSTSGSGDSHTHGWSNDGTWRPSFANAIVCTKN